MRVRLRGPGGAATITLADDATVGDLINQIIEKSSVSTFDVKYGYPPKPFLLEQNERSKPLKELDMRLDGEQLTISPKDDLAANRGAISNKQSTQEEAPANTAQTASESTGSFSFAGISSAETKQNKSGPVSLTRKAMEGEVPELPLPERGSTLGETIEVSSC
jgi:ubiquitin thioesterase OTU1